MEENGASEYVSSAKPISKWLPAPWSWRLKRKKTGNLQGMRNGYTATIYAGVCSKYSVRQVRVGCGFALQSAAFTDSGNAQPLSFGINQLLLSSVHWLLFQNWHKFVLWCSPADTAVGEGLSGSGVIWIKMNDNEVKMCSSKCRWYNEVKNHTKASRPASWVSLFYSLGTGNYLLCRYNEIAFFKGISWIHPASRWMDDFLTISMIEQTFCWG